jgi:hypothetical protein
VSKPSGCARSRRPLKAAGRAEPFAFTGSRRETIVRVRRLKKRRVPEALMHQRFSKTLALVALLGGATIANADVRLNSVRVVAKDSEASSTPKATSSS